MLPVTGPSNMDWTRSEEKALVRQTLWSWSPHQARTRVFRKYRGYNDLTGGAGQSRYLRTTLENFGTAGSSPKISPQDRPRVALASMPGRWRARWRSAKPPYDRMIRMIRMTRRAGVAPMPGRNVARASTLGELVDPSRGISHSQEVERSVSGNFLFPGEALTGLEVERSVLGISYSRRGGHWVGGGKIRLGPGNKGLLRRGGHWVGGGSVSDPDGILFSGEAVTGLEAERTVSDLGRKVF